MKLARPLVALLLLCLSFSAAAFGPAFDRLEKQLRIRPDQKEQFDAAVGATQRALLAVALQGMEMRQRIEDELRKPWPDLGAIARSQEDAVRQLRPVFREARDEWTKLYDVLDEDQVDIAKGFAHELLDRFLK